MALALLVVPWHRPPPVAESAQVFSATVREHEEALLRVARRLCGNDQDARDLVHDAYERALRNWDRYGEQGNVRGWLVAIMHNVFIDRCRTAKRRGPHAEIDTIEIAAPEPVAPPTWTKVDEQQVSRALQNLGAEFRQVYELHVQGKSYDEIAAELRIAKNTVGTRLLRARKKLREQLQHEIDRSA
jgi:RNA polymerase sigma-70 factor (ECF subfamily)